MALARARFVHRYDASSVFLMTFVFVATSPSALFELGQIDRLATRSTDTAVQGILDDERPERWMLVATEDVEDEGMRLRVVAARPAAAEAACSQSRTLAHPAIHNPSRSPRRRAQPGPDIMRRPGAKFAW